MTKSWKREVVGIFVLGAWFAISATARADEHEASGGGDAETHSLAKQSQNPVADLISVPFEDNINYNAGALEQTDNVLTIKPVYPIRLTEDLNLINRFLIPVISQGRRTAESGREKGLGDITYQMFLSPSKAGPLIWGAGPAIIFRTGTNDLLTSNKWSIGPNVLILAMPGHWVVGGLLSNVWSFAGADSAKDVSLMTLQPIVNYNFGGGWYLTSTPIIAADWKRSSSNTWTVPVGGGLGRVFRFGKQPLNARLAGYYNVEKPDDASDWTLSAQLTFLFPK